MMSMPGHGPLILNRLNNIKSTLNAAILHIESCIKDPNVDISFETLRALVKDASEDTLNILGKKEIKVEFANPPIDILGTNPLLPRKNIPEAICSDSRNEENEGSLAFGYKKN